LGKKGHANTTNQNPKSQQSLPITLQTLAVTNYRLKYRDSLGAATTIKIDAI